ncbi:aspartate aminotransferase family protein [uncultured Hyphomonas sp.]|uniref:aspartate aminotransferase family protein n=1 Tax=uncultured Hyphomonas sp. TaxID=225298 RepID=UPI002AAB04B2|nr:aspartate aminotransferase family protein [uncultured Hyphomonas sp.]
MTSIFHRSPTSSLPTAIGGQGVWLESSDGRRYLDASGGAAVSALGHGHPKVIEAICEQASKMAYAHTAFFTNEPSEKLAEFLAVRAPMDAPKVLFCSGGSEATETSLKLARAYHVSRGEPSRSVFIARNQSYHGATLGALSVSGNPGRRAPYLDILGPCRFIQPCYAYRHQFADETPEAYGKRAADSLEAEILTAGPENVAAFIAEPVVGATLGAVAAAPGYFTRISEICKKYGVLFIADEVMCGMGRTGTLFAVEQESVQPDIITMAKGLGGGYQPIGAVVTSGEIYDAIVSGPGYFEHGHTYIGHATACAAALAVQQTIEDEGLLAHVRSLHPVLVDLLRQALEPTGMIGDIRGRGFLIGVELVRDPVTKSPFAPEMKVSKTVKKAAMAEGLMVYPNSGCVDGRNGDHILIAPPYISQTSDLEQIADRLSRALASVLTETE